MGTSLVGPLFGPALDLPLRVQELLTVHAPAQGAGRGRHGGSAPCPGRGLPGSRAIIGTVAILSRNLVLPA